MIETAGLLGPFIQATDPVNGTDEVQTLTIGGTPTGGTFKLKHDGLITAAITWSSTNNTLLSNIQAALDARFGTNNIVASDSSLSSGIGDLLLTFGADLGRKAVTLMTVADNSLTGTAPTLAIAETTPGVDSSYRGAPVGATIVNSATGDVFVNLGTANAPTWAPAGGSREVSLSAADIIAMNGAPVTLIPAPGANRVIVVEGLLFKMSRTATAFTSGGALEFRYTNGSGAKVTADIAAAVVTTGGAGDEINHVGGVAASLTPVANAPIVITNATGAFASGTGTAKVYLKYRIENIA